jgi:hypothetical protein
MVSREVDTQLEKSYEDLKGWKVQGNIQLLPGEVRQLRDYLVGSGSFENFQIYVMLLVGIKLFLWAEELLNMKVEDFRVKYQIITAGKHIKALPVRVNGMYSLLYDLFFFYVLTYYTLK